MCTGNFIAMHRGQVFTFLPLISIFLLLLLHRCRGHLVDGVFTEPTLKSGYNLVTTVPKGAKSLNVTELGNTSNILAVRLQGRKFLLNGNDAALRSGSVEAAGTIFTYIRQDSNHLESLAAEGPLQEPVDILVFYREPNPGIVYRYIMTSDHSTFAAGPPRNSRYKAATSKTSKIFPPLNYSRRDHSQGRHRMSGDEAKPAVLTNQPQRKLRRRRFAWKSFGLTDCNRFCGGGVQVTRFVCVREQSQIQVSEKRCHHLEKPVGQSVRCNTRPCPAKWRAGAWSECSVSCGGGFRTRELECVQEVTPVLTMRVADGACIEPNILPVKEACVNSPCDDKKRSKIQSTKETVDLNPGTNRAEWKTETWSECSTSCGPGIRKRVVFCSPNINGRNCIPAEKPPTEESCDLGTCAVKTLPTTTVNSNAITAANSRWLYTEWSRQCSADCGTGIQWRRVACGSSPSDTCDESSKPKISRECTADASCSGHWFAGPWTRCSSACEIGEQTREVVCIAKIHGSPRLALEMNCPAEKPEVKRHCRGPPCSAAWFTSDWSECTRSCGKGVQQREVKCIGGNGRDCVESDRPIVKRLCNEQPCKNQQDNYGTIQIQNDPEISNRLDENSECKDTNFNCPLVVQARLCNYNIYRKTCCLSCSKARQVNE
ncbi:ADAMTS-like protein 4 isoform X2 [Athalia rosae]|uniref:ADAMTS-like protein 4 isoform X2 n=1 Tax=Athalia rosae TaxID=37344 RepID=UPI0020333EA2|nr:ADAMTS-like protein 4 isoform X2 [Athalia rosae]